MKIKVSQLDRLLFLLSEKTGEPLDRSGLRNIASSIAGISEDYLYKKIFYAIRPEKKENDISLRDAQLNSVVRFLGFKNIKAFVSVGESSNDEQLRSIRGKYKVFVRQNSSQGLVFQSPGEICDAGGKYTMRLTGPSWMYEGDIKIKHGCLFVLLSTPDNKSFYHIYKIGTSKNPRVIQGIFSGVSTAFDPIGGRVVLLKVNDAGEEVRNIALSIRELRQSPVPEDKKLAAYFKDYSKNNLGINKVISFGPEDLEDSP
jgi:hypothetical protein